ASRERRGAALGDAAAGRPGGLRAALAGGEEVAMSTEIKWTDIDPRTGGRRYLRAAQFAGQWRFSYRQQRRDVRWRDLKRTRAMWEFGLDSRKRRSRRREGVSDEDVAQVERVLREWREPPSFDEERRPPQQEETSETG